MNPQFDYQGAIKEGYSDDEIFGFLKEKTPNFDFEAAIKEGYSPKEINQFFSKQQPQEKKEERGLLSKVGRTIGQFGLGALENILLPYELGVGAAASEDAQLLSYRQNIMDDIERLTLQKQTGVFDEADQNLLDNLVEQIKDPEKARKNVYTVDAGVRNVIEKSTGFDTEPEGLAEKAANWAGFIKDPKKIIGAGLSKKELIKAIAPTGTEALRGVGAGTAMQLAEDEEFGPIGKMAATIVGDLAGGGLAAAGKQASQFAKEPKKYIAESMAKFSKADQRELQKEIVKSFREQGIKADVGTLTNSDITRMIQTKLAQSGFTGEALENFQKQLTGDIVKSYENLANQVGQYQEMTARDMGNWATNVIKSTRDESQKTVREFYNEFKKTIGDRSYVKSTKLANSIDKTLKELKPGRYKSKQQKEVIDILGQIKGDLVDSEGNLLQANVKDLLNNKIALNQAINYEVQGGVKQLLKDTVKEIDRAILSIGEKNPRAKKLFIQANQKASEQAKTFRNPTIDKIIRAQETEPTKILDMMNTIQGQKLVEKALDKTPGGKKLYKDLQRYKLDQIAGKNLIDGTTQQLKFGTFPKLLDKGKNREILTGILGKSGIKKLEKLQKNVGLLQESMQKFYNASKTFSTAADTAIIMNGLKGVASVLYGNPWPLMKLGAGITGGRQLANLLTNEKFITLLEDAILESKKGTAKSIFEKFNKLKPYFKQALDENKAQENQ